MKDEIIFMDTDFETYPYEVRFVNAKIKVKTLDSARVLAKKTRGRIYERKSGKRVA